MITELRRLKKNLDRYYSDQEVKDDATAKGKEEKKKHIQTRTS